MIQKVGFRAMIQKQAIMYNLAGYARNIPDGTVSISLQGDKNRIDKVLDGDTRWHQEVVTEITK